MDTGAWQQRSDGLHGGWFTRNAYRALALFWQQRSDGLHGGWEAWPSG